MKEYEVYISQPAIVQMRIIENKGKIEEASWYLHDFGWYWSSELLGDFLLGLFRVYSSRMWPAFEKKLKETVPLKILKSAIIASLSESIRREPMQIPRQNPYQYNSPDGMYYIKGDNREIKFGEMAYEIVELMAYDYGVSTDCFQYDPDEIYKKIDQLLGKKWEQTVFKLVKEIDDYDQFLDKLIDAALTFREDAYEIMRDEIAQSIDPECESEETDT